MNDLFAKDNQQENTSNDKTSNENTTASNNQDNTQNATQNTATSTNQTQINMPTKKSKTKILIGILVIILAFAKFYIRDMKNDNFDYKDALKAYNEENYLEAFDGFLNLCENGNADIQKKACNKLGLMYDTGKGVEKNENKAYVYFIKSCEISDILGEFFWGCANAGSMAESLKLYDAAIKYYEKTCNIENEKAKKYCQKAQNLKTQLNE